MTKLDVRLAVGIREDTSIGDRYLKLTAEVIYFDAEDDHWVNCTSYMTPEAMRGYDNLVVYAQADKYGARFYGAEVAYMHVYRAKLDEVERMVKTLRAVQRKLDRLQAEWGYPQTTADAVVRFAKAVGCTGKYVFGYYDKSSPRQDDHGFVWDNVEFLKMRISREEQAFARKYGFTLKED